MELANAGGGDRLRERVGDLLLPERGRALEVVAVAGHRDDVHASVEQPLGELAHAVGTEVEDDRRVLRRVEAWAAAEHDRLHELVRHAALVARAHGRDGVVRQVADAVQDRGERPVGSLPALVAIHRVVPADDRRDPVGRERAEVGRGRFGRDVAAVGERVDPRCLPQPLPAGEDEQRAKVVDVRVDSAVRDEPEEVHGAGSLLRAAKRPPKRLVLEDRAVLDGAGHADEILVQDPPRPDREVPHLGVAHLPFGEPHRRSRGGQPGRRVRRHEMVEYRGLRELDGIPRPRWRDPPAVEHDERDKRRRRRAHVTAARQIAANDSGSSEAPPTRAPSIALWAMSSAAFSGFTDPP